MDKKALLLNALISIAVSAGTVYGYHHFFGKTNSFVTVDLNGIIAKEKETYREQLINAATPEDMAILHNKSVAFADSLYKSVSLYAKNNHVVVFQSSALIGGESKDITAEVVAAYSAELKNQ